MPVLNELKKHGIRFEKIFLPLLALVLTLSFGALGAENIPRGLIIEPPSNPGLDVSISTDKSSYSIGDYLRVSLRVSQRAYVYVLNYDTTGDMKLVFPNRYSTQNLIGPGLYILPDGSYSFKIEGPAGTEHLQAIATSQRIDVSEYLQNPKNPFGKDPYPLIRNPEKFIEDLKPKLGARLQLKFGTGGPSAKFKIGPVQWNSDMTSFWVGSAAQNQRPRARFDYNLSDPAPGETLTFNAHNSYDPDGYITRYLWDFDDDGTTDQTGQVVQHTFYSSGAHRVRLTVQDNDGTRTSTTKTVTVRRPQPTLEVSTPSSFYSNGQRDGNWWWCNSRNEYGEWRWNSVHPRPDKAFLNFHIKVTNQRGGGSGYSTVAQVVIYDRNGRRVESGEVTLENSFRPQLRDDSRGVGQDAYGSYEIRNTSILTEGFRAKIQWPPVTNRYILGAQRESVSLAYQY